MTTSRRRREKNCIWNKRTIDRAFKKPCLSGSHTPQKR